MVSALRPAGSTHAWRVLRAAWALALPLPCPRCGLLVHAWQAWDLGHATDRVNGGDDTHLRPEHASCNRSAGGRLAHYRTHPHHAPGW